MKVTETRKTPYGIKRRRYKREGAEDLTTYEIPESVARAIGLKRIAETMMKWKRGEAMREMAAYRREFIRQRMDWKNDALAVALNLHVSQVKNIKYSLKNEQASQGHTRGDAGSTALRQVDRDPGENGRYD